MKFPPSRRTHILLKCAWNILQARSAVAEKALTHLDSENHSYGSTGVRVCTQGSLVFLVEPWQELGQLATHTELLDLLDKVRNSQLNLNFKFTTSSF